MPKPRLFAVAGIVGPIAFLGSVSTLGALEPGYSHLTTTMSVLGGVPGIRGALFNIGAIVSGMCVALFAVGLHRESRDGGGSPVGVILLTLGGIGLGLSGVFVCNEGCANVLAVPTAIGTAHMVVALFAGLGMGVAPIFLYTRFRRSAAWSQYALFALITGILANVPGIFFWVTMATTRLPAIEGLIQRLGIVFVLVWIEVMAWVLVRRNVDRASTGAGAAHAHR